MTGKFSLLNRIDSSGFIEASDGVRVPFKSSELFAYDVGRIAVGQSVTFDIKPGRLPEAINICPLRLHADTDSKGHMRRVETETRYVGFKHQGSVRSYQFELSSPGQDVQTIAFRIDLGLLQKHHIVIQDGPALCRHMLLAQHLELDAAGLRLREFVLGDQDVSAYQASLPLTRAERKDRLRKPSLAIARTDA
jgi:hypothetical protein